jgi:aryl sulfotransferase
MADIVWLASYPRSGNTWFRIFLANLLHPKSEPLNINDLPERNTIASARETFDEITGLCAGILTPLQIEILRPRVYETLAAESPKRLFLKVHDAYTMTPEGEPMMSRNATAGAIYIVRNPLDVAVSVAHHAAKSIDWAIEGMADEQRRLVRRSDCQGMQLTQKLLTWSGHVSSWLNAPGLPVHCVRYEDMQLRPMDTFLAAATFGGIACDTEAVRRAVMKSNFKELQAQELRSGFVERMPKTEVFFRQGKVGGWRQALTRTQVDRIVSDHGDMMSRLGYLTDDGRVSDVPETTTAHDGAMGERSAQFIPMEDNRATLA